MNKILTGLFRKGILMILLFTGISVSADIVYPARLQLVETAPGVFDVYFVLPVIQGRIVKARAVFPQTCQPLGEPVTEVDAYQKKMRWQIGCGQDPLPGQEIGIEGLLGSQIDIVLEVTTLDGRTYKSTLSPARPFYSIPQPPGLKEYLALGALGGSRFTLLSWELFLMVLVYFLTRETDRLGAPVLMLAAGMGLGYFLSWNEWLLVPAWAGPTLALLVTAALACLGIFSGKRGSDNTGPVLMGLTAVLIGAGFRKGEILSGYTQGEERILVGFAFLGFLAGAVLLTAISRQVWRVLGLWTDRFRAPAMILFAGGASGVLLWQLSLFWNVPSMLPSLPLSLVSLSLILVLWHNAFGRKFQPVLALAGFLLGYFSGLTGHPLPNSQALLLGVQGILLMLLYFNTRVPQWIGTALLLLGGIAGGSHLQFTAFESLSYPLARSAFFLLLLLAGSLLLHSVLGHLSGALKEHFLKYAPLVLLALCLALGLGMLYAAYEEEAVPLLASGVLLIPIASLACLLLAFALWPRRRKILEKLNVRRKAPAFSLIALLLAFFLLPVTLKVRNPWYSMDQMDPGTVHKVVENKLLNTYTAFNIAEEEVLFERLNENLEEGLLDHIYLDSRRRLNMGLREGSTVTVKEVSLGELGTPLDGGTSAEGMRYPATWTVTAQVKHLKHIHYRKNRYTGTIALKSIDNTWKISEITLTSEDRQVIASGNL